LVCLAVQPIAGLKDSKGLPDFIKENGISTWTSAFWDIYEGIVKADPDVANPFELAVAMFIGKNPGKSVSQYLNLIKHLKL
jgi:hypothetical protein